MPSQEESFFKTQFGLEAAEDGTPVWVQTAKEYANTLLNSRFGWGYEEHQREVERKIGVHREHFTLYGAAGFEDFSRPCIFHGIGQQARDSNALLKENFSPGGDYNMRKLIPTVGLYAAIYESEKYRDGLLRNFHPDLIPSLDALAKHYGVIPLVEKVRRPSSQGAQRASRAEEYTEPQLGRSVDNLYL